MNQDLPLAQKIAQWLKWSSLETRPDKTLVIGTSPSQSGVDEPHQIAQGKRYEIIRTLGKGAFGMVMLARDNRLGRMVAIKQLSPDRSHSRAHIDRFLQEARIAAQLDHPNIVAIYDVEDITPPRIFMEYLSGGNLEQLIEFDAPLPVEQALKIILAVLSGLHAVHQLGVIHRDLKPSNILFDQKGTPKISDFGVAYLPQEHGGINDPDDIVGTPEYMAPEQLDNTEFRLDVRTDLYAAGLILFEMLTGKRFHDIGNSDNPNHMRQIIQKKPLPGEHDFPLGLDPSCRHIIRTLLQPDPNQRYSSASEVIHAVKQVLAENKASTTSTITDP
ncbi:MAG: serine/threonine protein kinase, partial [Lentisphaerae bacterium]